MIRIFLFAVTLIFGCFSCDPSPPPKPNILFIAIDDLRPELGIYGNQIVRSPNIDALARQSVVFQNHYVTVPTCGASRASLLTGLLPISQKHLSNHVFRDVISKQPLSDKPESFVHHLRRNGYYTVGIGKITHSADGKIYEYDQPVGNELELPNSWDEMLMDYGNWGTGWNTFFAYSGGRNRTSELKQVKPYEAADVPDEGFPDGLIANLAVKKIEQLTQKGQPFFLGVGFFKPHLPFNAPKKYWDLYDQEDLPISPNPNLPLNVNRSSLHDSGEFNQYLLGEEKAGLDHALSEGYAQKLMHGYLACVSYTDAQVGKVLSALDSHGLMENTLIILWSDHGWHLGDHRVWGKHTLFDRALRSPLMIKKPGVNKAVQSEHIVSTVDIYPSILELCDLPEPGPLDGTSLVPLFEEHANNWDDKAFSYFKQGISLKTSRYRITRYYRENQPPNLEIYDHQVDPYETRNIAEDNPDLVDDLMNKLSQGNTGLYRHLE